MAQSILRVVLGVGNKTTFDNIVVSYLRENNTSSLGTFSEMFPLLFAENPQVQHNQWEYLLSFLQPVSEAFTHNGSTTWGTEAMGQLNRLFAAPLDINIPATRNALQFLAYLIEVYVELWAQTPAETRESIFQFMTDFHLSATTAVMIFHTPSGSQQSCGYAIHGAPTDTTTKVLSNLNDELLCVDRFFQSGAPLSIQGKSLRERQEGADLFGWIQQGILLMNIHLTYGHTVWEAFAHSLVSVVSRQRPNVAFILSGLSAKALIQSIENAIEHYIVDLYHPTHPNQTRNEIRWDINMPFINANFLHYQKTHTTIEWQRISRNDPSVERRIVQLCRFFDAILDNIDAITLNPRKEEEPFIIRGGNVGQERDGSQGQVNIRVSPRVEQNVTVWKLKKVDADIPDVANIVNIALANE